MERPAKIWGHDIWFALPPSVLPCVMGALGRFVTSSSQFRRIAAQRLVCGESRRSESKASQLQLCGGACSIRVCCRWQCWQLGGHGADFILKNLLPSLLSFPTKTMFLRCFSVGLGCWLQRIAAWVCEPGRSGQSCSESSTGFSVSQNWRAPRWYSKME